MGTGVLCVPVLEVWMGFVGELNSGAWLLVFVGITLGVKLVLGDLEWRGDGQVLVCGR